MASRRLFSSINKSFANKLNCSGCRFYDKQTTLCRFNNLNALNNRADDNICGIDGKHYWKIDETNLIKSHKYYKYSSWLLLSTLPSSTIFCLIDYPYSLYGCPYLCLVFYSSYIFATIGNDYKKKYKHDNNIYKNGY
jgi:hypothetical protein